MAPSTRIHLSGNLGERHRYLNALVLEAHHQGTHFGSNVDSPEDSAIDRLFKIDLASKQRNVDYIIQTLKDDDMLFVSRALKCFWLFEPEYWHIINPTFLEHELYRHMRLQAVNKMKHWIQMHLRDPIRCSEFYLFYKNKDFDTAAKFLWQCSSDYIITEFPNILNKITPKRLKLLSEKVPKVTQIYYENLKNDQILLKYYLDNDVKFFANIKFLLKADPDVFFYVTENFFVYRKFSLFSAEITKHIIKNHKSRFVSKPELYAAWFLNFKALAKCLSSDEIKDLVIRLAKAQFLNSWFSYKHVEPLVKSLSNEERTAFKKLVFIDKALGPIIKEWPYPIPAPPKLKVSQAALFVDRILQPPTTYSQYKLCSNHSKVISNNTMFDMLFDKYRFKSFQQTLVELRKQLQAQCVPQLRQSMFLVLVSKTGGRTEHLIRLLDLLSRYKNEPVQIRATIFRSLVRRAFVWRLPPEQWRKLLEWGHGLGLNGQPTQSTPAPSNRKPLKRGRHPTRRNFKTENSAEAACIEGLHAVIIRDLLANARPNDEVWTAFLNQFSPLAEYSLSSEERACIRTRLPTWLLDDAQSHSNVAVNRLQLLLDTLSAYQICFDKFPGTLEAIIATTKSVEPGKALLMRVWKAGVGRKTLIREYFDIIQTDASYINALKHDISILKETERFKKLVSEKDLKHQRFLQKLAIYFNEEDGLCDQYRAVIVLQADTKPDKILARPLALLSGSTFIQLLNAFDTAPPKTPQRQLAAALRSNAHIVRPPVDLDFGWRKMGAKAVTNRIITCRHGEVERYLSETLSWSRTLRLALVLAKRANKEHEAYKGSALKRPGAALKAALKYFKREADNSDPRIWHTVKHHIAQLDQGRCHYSITNVKSIPSVIKAEYCVIVYNSCKLTSKKTAISILYHIANFLNEVDDQFIIEVITNYLSNDCTEKVFTTRTNDTRNCTYLYVNIIAKFLLLSTTEEVCNEKFQKIGIPFFERIESLWTTFLKNTKEYCDLLEMFVSSLKYNKAIFDSRYPSCLIVFEKVTEWMHRFLPMPKWFDLYVEVHLMTIYVKSVRYCLKESPEIFSNEYRKQHEGVYMIGNIYGKFIANEVKDLMQKYFISVTEFYKENLVRFLFKIGFRYEKNDDESIVNFAKAMLKGMLSANETVPASLAIHVYKKLGLRCKDDGINDILKSFKDSESQELRFYSGVEDHNVDSIY